MLLLYLKLIDNDEDRRKFEDIYYTYRIAVDLHQMNSDISKCGKIMRV